MALSAIQRVMKDDKRLLVYALHNLVHVFIGLSNPDGELDASELLYQVRLTRGAIIHNLGVSMYWLLCIMISFHQQLVS